MEPTPIGPKKKIGFVCSGGGTKAGAFHLGVALALREKGFRFRGGLLGDPPEKETPRDISVYVGSSAGSIVSSYFAAGYSLENILNSFLDREPTRPEDAYPKRLPRLTYSTMFRFRKSLAKEQLYSLLKIRQVLSDLVHGNFESIIQLRWLKTTGFFSTSGIEEFFRTEVMPSNSFKDYRPELFIVGTQLDQPEKIVFGKNAPEKRSPHVVYRSDVGISEACAASTALPLIYSPYPIPGVNPGEITPCLDGEIRDTLSSHVAFDAGADLVFASYTHQPYQWTREIGSLMDQGISMILVQSLYLLIEQKISNFVQGKETQKAALQSVAQYCVENDLPHRHREAIIAILEKEFGHTRDMDAIYIHPLPSDSILFTSEHFSLSPEKLHAIVKSGFRAAARTLARYTFQF